MKILQFGISSNYGGIEQYVFKLFNQALNRGYIFDFLIFSKSTPYKEYYEEKKSKIFIVCSRKDNFFKNRTQVYETFNKNKYDIVHFHLNTLSYIYPVLCAVKSGSKVIVHSRSSGAKDSFITLISHFINKIILKKLKITRIAVSKVAGDWLFGKNTDYTIINNGVELDKYCFNSEYRNELRQTYGINNNFVIGHVGAFLHAKNHKFIVEIFAKICSLIPNSILVLVGDGPLKSEVIKHIKNKNISNKVILIGMIKDVEKYYSMFDYFLFPSHYEGYPNVVIESQASGLKSLLSENITNEVIGTNLCKKLSLKKSSLFWAKVIVDDHSKEVHNRFKFKKYLKDLGFDSYTHLNRVLELYEDIVK